MNLYFDNPENLLKTVGQGKQSWLPPIYPFQQRFISSIMWVTSNALILGKSISMGESNTVVSAYTYVTERGKIYKHFKPALQ